MAKICAVCGDEFIPASINNKYCSRQCAMDASYAKQKEYKQKWYLNKVGRTELLIRTSKERWIHSENGYVMIKVNGELVYEHRVLAEKALGRPLPKGAVVHHMIAPDDNHGLFKLVICPNQEYHLLLHKRMGHANNQYG